MFSLEFIAQILVDGIVTGSVYVLVAIGLTLIFGILGIVNFAHGELYMLGGYFGIVAAATLGVGMPGTLVAAIVGVALVGLVCERLVFLPLRERDMTSSIIASFGLAVVLQNAALVAFGPEPRILRTAWSSIPVELGSIYHTLSRAVVPVVALVTVVIVHLVLRYTWTGRSLRAMSQHPVMAELCGVEIDRVALVTFVIGGTLAGAAGALMSSVQVVQPAAGSMVVLKAFTVVILGGMGNVYGAVTAALALGVVEAATAAYVNNLLKDVVGFVMVIVVLLFRPQGIFGRAVERA
jgi:branched-chain amino acid transport system permease protein